MALLGPGPLRKLQAACRDCHTCVDAGIIPEANPTFSGVWGAAFFLVGQAHGPAGRESRRPFAGRAAKELDRWMLRAGFTSAEEFRRLTYIAALMRCFPGRNRAGTGDLRPPLAAVAHCAPLLPGAAAPVPLRPPLAAVANCAHWLEAELELLKPRVLILVGQMAIARFLGPGTLESRVGRTFGTRPLMVPLPHPSGQSRWLTDHANRARLEKALTILAKLRAEALV